MDAGSAGREWIDAQPEELAGQKRILRALLGYCVGDPDARWLAVSCSLARGAADRLSDVDAGIGAAAGQVNEVAEAVAGLASLGERVDTLKMEWRAHPAGSGTEAMRRIFVQCADGAQLDLVVMAAQVRSGRAPDEVVLLDRDARLMERFAPDVDKVTGDQIREWAFLGWIALANLAKYLDRGSLWEARGQLVEARDRIWALWAATKGARYPVFGLSQVLDRDPHDLPPGIDLTLPLSTDAPALHDAAIAAAKVLLEVGALAEARYPADLPIEMARFVARRLNQNTGA